MLGRQAACAAAGPASRRRLCLLSWVCRQGAPRRAAQAPVGDCWTARPLLEQARAAASLRGGSPAEGRWYCLSMQALLHGCTSVCVPTSAEAVVLYLHRALLLRPRRKLMQGFLVYKTLRRCSSMLGQTR